MRGKGSRRNVQLAHDGPLIQIGSNAAYKVMGYELIGALELSDNAGLPVEEVRDD